MIKKLGLPKMINDNNLELDLTHGDLEHIHREMMTQNIKRMRMIAILVIVFEPLMILFFDIPRLHDAVNSPDFWIYQAYIWCHSIIFVAGVPTVCLSWKLAYKSTKGLERLNYLVSVITPIIGLSIFAYLDMLDGMTTGHNITYIVNVLIMSVVLLLRIPINIITLVVPHILYIFLNYRMIGDGDYVITNIVNTTTLIVTMLFFNSYVYYTYQNSLKKTHALSKKTEELEYIASHDVLTGLLNRNAFIEQVSNKKTGEMVLLDLDYFKRINDTYSHLAGDSILVEFTELMGKILEKAVISRWGGEEFLIFWPDSDRSEVLKQTEKFRSALQQHEFFYDGITIHMTASFGITHMEGNYKEAFARIDKALYLAKGQGRNRIICN